MTTREFARRMRLCLKGWKMECAGCGAGVVLPTRKFGTVLDISGPEVAGWTFTSSRGWHCPTCTDRLEGA